MNEGHPDLDKLAREVAAKVGQMLFHKITQEVESRRGAGLPL